jgi:hypothetical protein
MELHDAFTRWLIAGQGVSLARDVAVHASACPECLRATAAFDALTLVDAAAAPEPPVVETSPDQRAGFARGAIWTASATAALAIVVTGVMAVNGAFGSPALDDVASSTVAEPGSSVAEGVLGNRSSPSASAEAGTPTASAEGSPGQSGDADPAEPSFPAPAPTPTLWGQPPPVVPYRPTVSPSPVATARSTPAATAATTATAAPTPTPAPTPGPTPALPPECSNDEDDDGDGFTDFGVDLGCASPADDDERDASDFDGDGVADPGDLCPEVPAGQLPDPELPGCPLP